MNPSLILHTEQKQWCHPHPTTNMGAFNLFTIKGLGCEQSSSFQFVYLIYFSFFLLYLFLVHAFPALTFNIQEDIFFPINPTVPIYYCQRNEAITFCLK